MVLRLDPRRAQLRKERRRHNLARKALAQDRARDGLPPPGESWLTAAIPMENRYCSCRLTRVRSQMIQGPPHTCYNSIESCPAPDPEVCNKTEVSCHGLQLQSLWIIPTAAVGES